MMLIEPAQPRIVEAGRMTDGDSRGCFEALKSFKDTHKDLCKKCLEKRQGFGLA
jgi:hypothetical protein